MATRRPARVDIVADARKASKVIVDAARSGGRVVNLMGLAIRENEPVRRIASHILQGVESAALRAIVRRYGTRVTLCMHDGCCCEEGIDPADAEELIHQETGISLGIEESRM